MYLARQRPCTFSKDGSKTSPATSRPSTPPPVTHQAPLSTTKYPNDDLINSTMETLNRLNKLWPGEGREGKWEIDTGKLRQSKAAENKEENDIEDNERHSLPTKEKQLQLVHHYYNHCYALFPILPKRIFFKHFNHQSNHSLLLYAIFAHGAINKEEGDQYFQHAKSLLLEYTFNTNQPKLSTIIALILMTLYESNENTNYGLYSALAFQMAMDLDLMRDYSHNIEREGNNHHDDKELRKRVCWGCYTLDKLLHIQSGQPWILRSKDIELDMPLLQPGDDVLEHTILESFVSTIKLLQIAERILQPESLQQIGQPVIRTHAHDQMSFNMDNDLLHWFKSLPSHLHWSNSNNAPPSTGMACQLHILYNLIELYILKPFSTSTVKSIQQRSLTVASNLTQLSSFLPKNITWILLNETFVLNALFESIQLHLKFCSCENLNFARSARSMFQLSVETLRRLIPHIKTIRLSSRIIQFTQALDQAINEADSTNTLFSDINEQDIMTPFVLGSLNAKYSEEERQQWSKLDYFANGLITPPTVKSKAPSITMSSTMFVPNNPSSYYTHHSAVADTLFSTNTHTSSSSTWKQTNNASVNNHASELLIDQSSHPSDLAAFVAQMQDNANSNTNTAHSLNSSPSSNNNNNNSNKDWSDSSTPVLLDESTSAPNTTSLVANDDNDNLLYSLLSNQRTTSTPTVTSKRQYQNSYTNVGLGIYASAHQHHNDVIRQHLPLNKSFQNQ